MSEKTQAEKSLRQQVESLMHALQEQVGNDERITAILMISLSWHLHSCQNGALAESALNYLGSSFHDLFQNLLPPGTITDVSMAVH
jgi:hypothetical protein